VREFFRTCRDRPWGPPRHSCTMGTGSIPGLKRPGRGVDHPPPSSAEVKERVELYLYSPSGPSWPVIGWPLPLYCFFTMICVLLFVLTLLQHAAASPHWLFTFLTNFKISNFNKEPTSSLKMIWIRSKHVGEFLSVLMWTF